MHFLSFVSVMGHSYRLDDEKIARTLVQQYNVFSSLNLVRNDINLCVVLL